MLYPAVCYEPTKENLLLIKAIRDNIGLENIGTTPIYLAWD
jgi:hypothetical protein